MLEDMLGLANSACTTPHAGHDTARHRTVLRHAVELAKLNGAGDTAVCFFVLSAIRSWV